jgi:hypothetical protein
MGPDAKALEAKVIKADAKAVPRTTCPYFMGYQLL